MLGRKEGVQRETVLEGGVSGEKSEVIEDRRVEGGGCRGEKGVYRIVNHREESKERVVRTWSKEKTEPCRGEVGLAGPAACASASASSGAGGESVCL